ncbi:MAG: hypothetical protein ACI4QM_02350 [Alphaproteobacteria bacterium]
MSEQTNTQFKKNTLDSLPVTLVKGEEQCARKRERVEQKLAEMPSRHTMVPVITTLCALFFAFLATDKDENGRTTYQPDLMTGCALLLLATYGICKMEKAYTLSEETRLIHRNLKNGYMSQDSAQITEKVDKKERAKMNVGALVGTVGLLSTFAFPLAGPAIACVGFNFAGASYRKVAQNRKRMENALIYLGRQKDNF